MSVSSGMDRQERLLVSPAHAALLDEPLPRAVWALYLLLAVVVAGIAWAALARVDEITRSEGRVIPDGREQVIASLESGILSELLVREGQEVEAGQPLARLDPTRATAAQNESQAKRLALLAQVARLQAEAFGRPLAFPPEVKDSERVVAAETEVFEARRRVVEEGSASTGRSIELVHKELRLARGMAEKGLMSDVEVMRLTRQVNELQAQRTERISRFRQDASAELSRAQTELAQLDEQLVVRADTIKHTELKSPVRGLVKSIKMNTLGGVVPGGSPLMDIVPTGPRVLVEARVKPSDIGFVQLGQPAIVKLNGYDFNVMGGLEGKIEYISPDALGDTERGAQGAYYRAVVAADRNNLMHKGKPLPVIPGMTASVEIRTGERSVLSYLLRPMLKSREALRER
ncbi:HlyD family type I secretion periplasmic adaptor subunit [Roseateles sp. BYS96W]|uniref:Membrane fusion protein (MFP) family protein n=1 Tax=Pelomonas nitida TaxID=3299027 RepID=A0ABW7G5A7_9BURK